MLRYKKYLYLFAVFFIAYFYFIPLCIIRPGVEFFYSGRLFVVSLFEWWLLFGYGVLFLVSFFIGVHVFFRYLSFNVRTDGVCDFSDDRSNRYRILIISLIYSLLTVINVVFFYDIYADYDNRVYGGGGHLSFFLNIVSGILGYFLLLESDNKRYSFVTLILLCVLLFVVFSTSSGRVTVLTALFLSGIFFFRGFFKVRYVLFGLILFSILLPVIINMKEIIYNISVLRAFPNLLSYYSEDFDILNFISNFGHPLVSAIVISEYVDINGYNFFYDYIQGFLFYLKILGLDFGDSVTYLNTELLLGVRESIVPPGYIAFGVLQFGVVGVILSGFFWAFIGFVCCRTGYVLFPRSEMAVFFFSFLAANSFYHGDVRIIVLSVFLVVFVFYILNVLFRLRF